MRSLTQNTLVPIGAVLLAVTLTAAMMRVRSSDLDRVTLLEVTVLHLKEQQQAMRAEIAASQARIESAVDRSEAELQTINTALVRIQVQLETHKDVRGNKEPGP